MARAGASDDRVAMTIGARHVRHAPRSAAGGALWEALAGSHGCTAARALLRSAGAAAALVLYRLDHAQSAQVGRGILFICSRLACGRSLCCADERTKRRARIIFLKRGGVCLWTASAVRGRGATWRSA